MFWVDIPAAECSEGAYTSEKVAMKLSERFAKVPTTKIKYLPSLFVIRLKPSTFFTTAAIIVYPILLKIMEA